MTRVISVISGKGGVGKTTISINLAAALAELEEDVLLVDANLENPNVSVHLGTPHVPISLTSVVKGKHHVNDSVYVHTTGLRVVPASLAMNSFGRLDITRLGKTIDALRKKAKIVVIDTPPGMGAIVKMILKKSDHVIVVTNPELPAISDAIKAIKLAELNDNVILGVVVNKLTYDPTIETSAKDVEALLEYPIISAIPSEKTVKKALCSYSAAVHSHPNSLFSKKMTALAAKLVGKSHMLPDDRGFFARLFRLQR